MVLPYIKMNLPQVYMCSASWTLLPPPSSCHPSGLSQRTSPKHPVLCIEPGLVTRFIYDILHISMLKKIFFFLTWTIFKEVFTEFVTIQLLLYVLVFGQKAYGILTPQPGLEPALPALEGGILTTGPPGKFLSAALNLLPFSPRLRASPEHPQRQWYVWKGPGWLVFL